MKVRLATDGDISHIARIQVDSWRTTYAGLYSDRFLKNLKYEDRESSWRKNGVNYPDGEGFTLVLENASERIVGFAAVGPQRESKESAQEGRISKNYDSELYAIYLLQEVQGMGGGKLLFKTIWNQLQAEKKNSLILWVHAENKARQFYERLGGKMCGEKLSEVDGQKYISIAYNWHSF